MNDEFRLDGHRDDDPTAAAAADRPAPARRTPSQPSPDGLRRIRAEIARQAPASGYPAAAPVRRRSSLPPRSCWRW